MSNLLIRVSEKTWIGPEVYNNLVSITIENHMDNTYVVNIAYRISGVVLSIKPIVGADIDGLETKIFLILAEIDRLRKLNKFSNTESHNGK